MDPRGTLDRAFFWSWKVRVEKRNDSAGETSCEQAQHKHRRTTGIEELPCHLAYNLVHLLEDIDRFSSPDNFWCYSFERAVRKYIENSTNKKNIEQTFANAEARREFLKFFRPHQQCQLQSEGLHAREIVSDEIMHACNFLSNIIYYTAWCKQH